MQDFTTKTFGRIAVATMLSLGLSAGAVTIASASTSHASAKADKTVAFQGTVSVLATGTVTVVNSDGTMKMFTVSTTTKILRAVNVNNAAVLSVGDRVVVRSLMSAPLAATSVNILAVKASKTVAFQGKITALPAGSVTVVNSDGTSKTFTIATTTKILRAKNVKHTAVLAPGDRVVVRALASTPLAATSINILAVK